MRTRTAGRSQTAQRLRARPTPAAPASLDVRTCATEPLPEQPGPQLRLLMGQGVASAVEDGEARSTAAAYSTVDSWRPAMTSVGAPGMAGLGQGQLPVFADSRHRRRIDKGCGQRDKALAAIEHRKCLYGEVVAEFLIAHVVRADRWAVLGEVAHTGQKGQTSASPGTRRGHRAANPWP